MISLWVILSFTIATMIVIEFLPRYLANKTKKTLLYNILLVNFTYLFTKISTFFFRFSPKKKITSYSEQDVIRYVKNLSIDNIIENKEAQLVQAAFNFDELTIENIMIPYRKIIFLNEKMKKEEIEKIYSIYSFLIFPVKNEKEEIIGTFDFQNWYKKEKEMEEKKEWQNEIKRHFLQIEKNTTLDKLLDSIKEGQLKIAIISDKKIKKNVGLITKKDIFDALLGKTKQKTHIKNKKKK